LGIGHWAFLRGGKGKGKRGKELILQLPLPPLPPLLPFFLVKKVPLSRKSPCPLFKVICLIFLSVFFQVSVNLHHGKD
jgi:hypothetical protein